MNSIMMAVPAVTLSTVVGALNGYVLTKWQFRGATLVFGLLLFSCFIPFQIVLIPMARILGILQIAGTTPGLILVHFVYGIGFTTLYFRNYYAAFPTNWCARRRSTGPGSSRSSGASCCRPRGRSSRSASSGSSPTSGTTSCSARRSPRRQRADDGGAQQPRQLVHGRAEYNVHFAGAIMAAAPTLLVYIVAGRYFVRGLMAGLRERINTMGFLDIDNVTKSYGAVEVLHRVDISVEEGEFLVLVGPSGCGKSTLLNMIAGLEGITSGEIKIKGAS
jgi:glucose/mannose transport system permease protein